MLVLMDRSRSPTDPAEEPVRISRSPLSPFARLDSGSARRSWLAASGCNTYPYGAADEMSDGTTDNRYGTARTVSSIDEARRSTTSHDDHCNVRLPPDAPHLQMQWHPRSRQPNVPPLRLAPVLRAISPDAQADVTPVARLIAPLTPATPASAVAIDTAPEEDS